MAVSINVSKGSWLNSTSLLEFRGIVFWDHTDYPDVPFSQDDRYLQLNDIQAKRPDLVAHDAYGDSELLWVLQLANDCELPLHFYAGQYIRIPARATVEKLLTNSST